MKRSLFLTLASFAVIYCVNFFLPRLMPGDPFSYTSSVSGEDQAVSAEQKAELMAYYGLDKPLAEQFAQTIKRNLSGDLGLSTYYKKNVGEVIATRLPWSLYLMFASLLLSVVLGTSAALHGLNRPKLDAALYGVFSVFAEIPAYLVGVLFLFLVGANAGFLPISGGETPFMRYDGFFSRLGDILLHSILPIASLTAVTLPRFYFTARASFITVAGKAYVDNARSRAVKKPRILKAYILRNGLSPVATRFFLSVGTAVGGTILVENVFAYPGIGRTLREAVMYRDYAMIQGVFLVSSIIVLLSLLLADIIGRFARKEEGL